MRALEHEDARLRHLPVLSREDSRVMRVLAGAVVRQHPEVLDAYLRTLMSQEGDAHVDYFFIDDHEGAERADESRELLERSGARVEKAAPRASDEIYGVDDVTHRWSVPTFYRLAREKQRILDTAVAEGYDAVWLVDSDLLCGPETLRSLLATEKPIVSAVFWTQWEPRDSPLPQVWVRHPYGFDGAGWDQARFLRALEDNRLVRVRGLGANTLIRSDALRSGAAYWPLVEGLPSDGMWQGEDRHFCIRAERAHIEMWADAWPRVWHCYRPRDRERISEILAALEGVVDGSALPGDRVSFTVEPCEEPQLVHHREHVRGEIGALRVLPEIETALREMRVGDARFVRAHFPASWPLAPYRGQSRVLRVKLLDIGRG